MDMNEIISCPLVEAHQVSRRRLQYHLAKCIKTYKGRKLQCPYNACEYFLPEEFEEHFKHCKSMGDDMAHHYPLVSERDEAARIRNLPAPFHHSGMPMSSERWGLE